MPAPITADILAWWIRPTGPCIPARLGYDPAAPLAVTARFGRSDGDSVWTWSREHLRTALDGPSGDPAGDVLMWRDGQLVHVWLRATHDGDHDCILAFGRREVARFLARTERLVPYGREPAPDLDAELAALLGGAR